MKLVSIIIPAHNEEDYLKNTLESIKSQNYPNIETIVVCNGCTDNTKKIANAYTSNVFSIEEPNVSKARNSGVKQAKGEILVFLDADTILLPEVISKISNELANNSSFGTVAGKSEINKFSLLLLTKTKDFLNIFIPWSNGIIYLNKQDFLKTNGFNENLKCGELRGFYKELKPFSKYKKLNSTYVITSQRRLKSWGIINTLKFWIYKRKEYNPIR